MASPNEIARAIVAFLKGMRVTLTNMLRRPVTLQYPEERHELPPGYRGLPSLVEDEATGKLKCTGCGVCARNCPIRAIEVTSKQGEDGKRTVDDYSIDMSKCMICGLCVESCPFGALAMFGHYELATADKSSLVYGKNRLVASNLEREKLAADRRLTSRGSKRSSLRRSSSHSAGSRG